jgi:hypothetical protein
MSRRHHKAAAHRTRRAEAKAGDGEQQPPEDPVRTLPPHLFQELQRRLGRTRPVPGLSPTEQEAKLAAELIANEPAVKHATLKGSGEAPPSPRRRRKP